MLILTGSTSVIDRSEAEKTYEELESIGETKDPKLLDRKAFLCNELALFYQSIDDNQQAVVFLEQTIEHTLNRISIENDWNAQNLRDILDLYGNITAVQASSGFIDDAANSFQRAEAYFSRLRPMLDDSSLYRTAIRHYGDGLGYCYHAGNSELGITYGNKALGFAIKLGDSSIIAECYRKLCELKSFLGNQEEALKDINKAVESIRANNGTIQLPQQIIRSKIGLLYKMKRYSEIIQFMSSVHTFRSTKNLNRSIQNYTITDRNYVIDNLFILSYAYIRNYQISGETNQLNQAQKWQNLAYTLAEKAIIENGVDRLGQVMSNPEGKITSTLKNYELLEQQNALSQLEIGQLLRTIDTYHSTQLHLNRLKNEFHGESWNRQKVLKEELDQVFNQMSKLPNDHPDIDSLSSKTRIISQELTGLALTTKHDKITQEYKLGRKDFFKKIKQYSLKKEKSIVTYIWSQRFSKLFIIGRNPKRYFFKSVPLASDFLKMVNESYQLNAHFQTDLASIKKQDSLNNKLYTILIAPIKKELTTNNLLVYPIGTLSYISFEALKPNQNEFLIETYNTSYTSSLSGLIRSEKLVQKNRKVASFQPTRYGNDSLATLFHVKDEIRTLDSCTALRTFKGNAATKRKFLAQNESTQILHVASHSVLNANNPYESYLIFQEADNPSNYQLKASEVFTKSFNADLVVLSSCNSAKGKPGDEIGIISVSNAFYYSGVPSTLGSLWNVQDNSSSVIISDFYRNLFQNQSKSKSLTKAKRTYLNKADAIKKQPFFWANYALYGDDSSLGITHTSYDYSWIIAGFFVALIVVILLYIRFKRSRVFSK